MKSIVLSSVAIAVIFFSGCSDKEPAVDQKQELQKPKEVVEKVEEVAEKVEEVKTEVVSENDSLVDSTNALMNSETIKSASESMNISDIQNQFSTIYFDFDKFNISSDMQSKISDGVEIVNKVETDFNIKLEGNCDEWGSDEYNFALGLKRANSVKKSLIAEGVDSERISMVSYGESNPTCNDQTKECWSKNRRVDFTLLP
ncbi:MAG: OmpA family protein [Campylobacterota bacterium]|nr:OmpA family protein [Campylobacterota bacterium]